MTRCFLTLLVALATASAMAQAPGDEGPGDTPRRFNDDDGAQEEGGRRGGRRGRGDQADDQGGPGDRGGRFGGPGGFRRSNPIFEALDVDGDQIITAAELRRAVANLKKLDADEDGNITLEEVTPRGGGFGDPSQMVDRMMERDANGDGKLQADEIQGPMAGMLQNADTNNDGGVDRAELEAAMTQMRQRFGGGPGGGGFGGFGGGGFNPQQMLQQMAQLDRNGDGRLTPDEVPDQMRRMLQGGDANGDGAIDRAELEGITQRMGERFGGRNFGGNRGGFGGEQGERGERGGRGARDADEGDEDEGAGRRSRRQRPESDE